MSDLHICVVEKRFICDAQQDSERVTTLREGGKRLKKHNKNLHNILEIKRRSRER